MEVQDYHQHLLRCVDVQEVYDVYDKSFLGGFRMTPLSLKIQCGMETIEQLADHLRLQASSGVSARPAGPSSPPSSSLTS